MLVSYRQRMRTGEIRQESEDESNSDRIRRWSTLGIEWLMKTSRKGQVKSVSENEYGSQESKEGRAIIALLLHTINIQPERIIVLQFKQVRSFMPLALRLRGLSWGDIS